jgi:membrane protein implicated in regulation of membrane protease activity
MRGTGMGPLVRYSLLQIPGLVLVGALLWWGWSLGWLGPGTGFVLFLVWLVKDILLYPFYRPALERNVPHGSGALVGRVGVVSVPLEPVGRVRVASESWRARSESGEILPSGTVVRVTAARGLTLLVRCEETTRENKLHA